MESSKVSEAGDLKRVYEAVLNLARRIERKIEVADNTIISYSRGAEPPSIILYISSLHAGLSVILANVVELALHIIPYRECKNVIFFSSKQKDSRVVNAAIASSILGARTLLVSPKMQDIHEERLKIHGVERVIIDSPSPILVMSFIALYSSPKLMGFREERVRDEMKMLDSALEWIADNYGYVADRSYENILYTPATMAGAYYYCHATRQCSPMPLDALEDSRMKGRALAMITSLEKKEYLDLLLQARDKMELDVVELNVDPVMASIYSVLIGLLASKRAI